MKATSHLRTIDLARAGGVVVEVVRTYERLGFLPLVERAPNGYRRYEARHMAAMLTSRTLIAGVGWQPALEIMRCLHTGDLDAAVARTIACHAELDRRRNDLLATLELLRVTAAVDSPMRVRRPVTIGEAARLVDVHVSVLRFWEQRGLLKPARDAVSRYRLYDGRQIQRLRVIALLRRAGYDFDAVQLVLNPLAAGKPQFAITAAERRLADLAKEGRQCVAATAALWEYVTLHVATPG